MSLLKDTEPNVHPTRTMHNNHGFHSSKHWKVVFWLENTETLCRIHVSVVWLHPGPNSSFLWLAPSTLIIQSCFHIYPAVCRRVCYSSRWVEWTHFSSHLPFLRLNAGKKHDMRSHGARRQMGKSGLFSPHSLLQSKTWTCWPLCMSHSICLPFQTPYLLFLPPGILSLILWFLLKHCLCFSFKHNPFKNNTYKKDRSISNL